MALLDKEELDRVNREAAAKGYEPLSNKTVRGKDYTTNYEVTDSMARDAEKAYQDIRNEKQREREINESRTLARREENEANPKPANALAQALANTTQTTAANTITNPTNNAAQNSGNPLINALRAKIQEAMNLRKQQSQTLKNQSEVTKANDLKAALEFNANMGDRGGIGRQSALETQTAGENRLNAINLAELNDITNLQTEGLTKESEIEAQALKDALAEKQRLDDIAREQARYNQQQTYQQGRDAQADSRYWADYANNQTQQDLNTKLDQQTYDYNKQQQEYTQKQQEQSQLQQKAKLAAQAHYNDIQGYINTLDPDDPIRPYMEAERNQKILDAQARYQQQGIVTADLAPILGLPVGTMAPQYEQKQKELQAKTSEAALKAEKDLAWDKWTKNAPLTAREYQLIGVPQGTRYVPPKNTAPIQKASGSSKEKPWYLQ